MNRYIMYVTGNIVVTSGNHACTVNVYDKNVYIRLSLCPSLWQSMAWARGAVFN